MILIDCETTGLVQPMALPLGQQPHIIEFAALKINPKTLNEVGYLHFLCRPPVALSETITKITGLKDEDLKDQPPFVAFLSQLQHFFFKEDVLVAHNLPFDRSLLSFELTRLDKLTQFPWPYRHYCTVELTLDIKGRRLKQEELYQMATGKTADQTHRALDDVRQLAEVVRWLRKQERI